MVHSPRGQERHQIYANSFRWWTAEARQPPPQSAGATELVQLLAPAARVARLVCTLMGRVHHKLLGAPGKVQTSSYLKQLCHDIVSSLGRENVTCHLRCRELAAEKVTSLALLIFELLTNSFKHAFPGNQSGHVEVCLKRDGEDVVRRYSDSGDGLPKQFEIEKSRSTGMLLTRTFTSQLGGKLTGAGSPFQSELDASLFRRRLSTRSAYYRP